MKGVAISIGILLYLMVTNVFAGDFLTITSSDITLYESPATGSSKINPVDNLFGKSFEKLEKSGEFYKIRYSDSQNAFISAHESFLENTSPSNYILAKRLPGSKLFQKALIVNRPDASGLIVSDISYFSSPSLKAPYLGKITIFEIRYIYGTAENSILVGRTDRMEKGNSDAVLVGWIDKKHIIEWNNLVGVEFDKTNYDKRLKCEAGKIFAEPTDLAIKGMAPVFNESKSSNELPYYANRFPVLDQLNDPVPCYKIAYIGSAFGTGGKQADMGEVDAARNQIMQILNMNAIQIAILIDATSGMREHIENVKKAVQEFLSELSAEGQLKAEIAVCVYRDYPDGDKIFRAKSDFSSDIVELQNRISTIRVYSNRNDNGAGAFPEAMFHGIDQTIEQLSWNKSIKGEKYILLIGDHGNHNQYDQYPEDRVYSAPLIGQKLKENMISLFALQVNISENKRIYNEMFERQVLDIKQNNQGLGSLKKIYGRSDEEILSGLKDILIDFSVIKTALAGVRDSTSILGKIYTGVFTQKLLERYHIKTDVFNAVQICDIGYVPFKNACDHNQFFEKVLITRKQLESLKVQMQEMSDAAMYYYPESEDKFRQIVFMVVKALTGDELAPNEEIAAFIEKKTGIPVNTELLRLTIDQLLDNVRDKRFRKVLRKYLEERIMYIDSVIKEKVLKDKVWDKSAERFLYNISDNDIHYFFSLEQPIPERGKVGVLLSRKNYAWMPLEYLP
ncbi:MAG: VWA domain-containing protein [Proteobacteria bacterium]|nr:VWA domain-containing protein [Pseudomonadota bacterium]